MSERFTIPARFKTLEDAQEHGHEATVALAAELDGGSVTEPDENGVMQVTIDAESREQAVVRAWEYAVSARIADFLESVG